MIIKLYYLTSYWQGLHMKKSLIEAIELANLTSPDRDPSIHSNNALSASHCDQVRTMQACTVTTCVHTSGEYWIQKSAFLFLRIDNIISTLGLLWETNSEHYCCTKHFCFTPYIVWFAVWPCEKLAECWMGNQWKQKSGTENHPSG